MPRRARRTPGGSVSASREIAVSAPEAWAVLVDWSCQGAWMPFTVVRELGGVGSGARLEAVTGVGPLRVVDPMTVTTWEPPHLAVVRHEGHLLRGTGTFRIEPLGPDRCRVTWREDLERPPGIALTRPFFAWALRRFERVVTRAAGRGRAGS